MFFVTWPAQCFTCCFFFAMLSECAAALAWASVPGARTEQNRSASVSDLGHHALCEKGVRTHATMRHFCVAGVAFTALCRVSQELFSWCHNAIKHTVVTYNFVTHNSFTHNSFRHNSFAHNSVTQQFHAELFHTRTS